MSNQIVPSPDDMITSFPNPTLPTIDGEAPYEQLVELRDSIKENYASIPTRRGGGEYGYLGGILSNAVYNTICPLTPFMPPTNPGVPPTIEAQTTAIVSGNMLRIWNEASREWKEWQSLERAAKKQLVTAVPSGMLVGIRCPHRGFNNISARTMLEYLFDNYGHIDQQDLINNRMKLTEEWDPNLPFSHITQRVQAVQEYATDGKRPINKKDIMDAIYTVVFNTGMFYEDCEKWNDKDPTDMTWTNFQNHFIEAQRRLKRRQKATTKVGGYHGANAVVQDQLGQANDALINLAAAATADREMMQLQAKTIADQMRTINDLTQQVKDKDLEIARLRNTNITPTPGSGGNNPKWINGKHIWDQGGYCHSHGFFADPANHTSKTCKTKKDGHQDEATRDNPMGCSLFGKPRK